MSATYEYSSLLVSSHAPFRRKDPKKKIACENHILSDQQSVKHINKYTMKLSGLALVAAVAAGNYGANAFAFTGSNAVRTMSPTTSAVCSAEESSTALMGRRRKGKKRVWGKVDFKEQATVGGYNPDITESEVRSLFSLWNDALATGDSKIVANRYANTAILLPTVSDVPRTDFDSIKDYFDSFLLKKPQGEILEGEIRIGDGWCQDAGIYEFTMGATGDKVKARYTYVYVYENGQWKIAHHHSSIMPEGIDVAKPITEGEVRGLFQLWNAALDTGDSATVANRYAKAGVLLPTVSDIPRTDYDSIKDYFDSFLLKKPQGEILESNVIVGTNWCQDAGIYEFTMGATGDKVKGRYSFIYMLEDGQWKIAHHHSSVMPEAQLAASSAAKSSTPAPIADDE
eukprot:15333676-Ditylum_brightwellii.AAC.1